MNIYSIRQKYLNTRTWGALEFIRIFNMTMPFVSGFTGVVLASKGISLDIRTFSGILIPLFLWTGGQIFNDIFDLDVDKINMPYRAIPSGRFTLRESVVFGGILTLIGIFLSIMTGSLLCQMLTILAVLLSNLYSYWSKRKGIFGHLNFAFCVLLCIYIGQSAVTGTIVSVYAPLGVFMYHVSLNIMASVGDISGDKKTKVITLPVQIGGPRATFVASVFWAAAVAWSSLFSQHSIDWFIIIVCVVVMSLYSSQLLFKSPLPANATTTMRLLRLGTILLQFSLVVQYLSGVELAVLAVGIGTFTTTMFLLFEVPKGIYDPLAAA